MGSIFRTADGAGVKKILLSGYSPTPFDQFGRERKDFAKVSLGAQTSVAWEQVTDLAGTIEQLRKDGYEIIVLERTSESAPISSYKPHKKFAVILGNEVLGVSKETLDAADAVLEIPMRGEKESLNVSVAAGIALYTLLA